MSSMLDPLADPGGESVTDLLSQLKISSESSSKRGRARKNQYPLWENPEIKITGWKFNEWDYGSSKLKLPIEARGLFTYKDKIVIRGYNKFFNIDEVPETKWNWIDSNTQGPYYLSLKENGCIVFMSGLEDGTLIVTSKNSTGPRDEALNEKNHSYVASQWVEKHLRDHNCTKEQLAKDLNRLNVTAVAELCDDSFEEHVLPYTGDDAGLYLHGLNLNTPKFATYPSEEVDKFSERYGFFKTKYLVKNDLTSLKQFLNECAETGSWEGRDVEGFVIRCKATFSEPSQGDYFFKFKFKEPYLMYRDWREVTKAYLSGKARNDIKILRHKAVTNQYLDYVIPLLDSDPQLRKQYSENHGIIKVRQMFLDHVGKSGIDLVKEEESNAVASSSSTASISEDTKFVFIPASVIGCGKTTLFVALSKLFDWGHIQNDELEVAPKRKKVALVNGASDLLNKSRAVLVDRNNHKFMEREQLITDMSAQRKNLKYICINFWPESTSEKDVWDITRQRIAERGDNHATIKLTREGDSKVDEIMKGFMKRFQPVIATKNPDGLFDSVIDMDVTRGTKYNLEHTVKILHEKYPMLVPEIPTSQQLDAALDAAMSYTPKKVKPTTTTLASQGQSEPPKKKAKKRATFFNIGVSMGSADATKAVVDLIDKFYASNPEVDNSFWESLQGNNQIQQEFHITLAHVNGTPPGEKKLFEKLQEKYSDKFQESPKKTNTPLGPKVDLSIESIGHNNKIMALQVTVHDPDLTFEGKYYHITIGMRDGVKPFASNEMLANKESSIIVKWNIEPSVLKQQPLCAFI